MSQRALSRFRDPSLLVAGAIPMRPSMTAPVVRRRPGTGLLYLITSGLLTLLEPLTGAILAAFILGQRLSTTGIAGGAILTAAVLVTVRGADGVR
jgi:hypothetical protein